MRTISLTQGRVALVDDEDYERLLKFKWYYSRKDNGVRCGGSTLMSHEVLQIDKGMVDHKEGNGLDNQKSNLRSCTYSQNNRNRKKTKKKTSSKYKGVHFENRNKKWCAQIRFLGVLGQSVCSHLGYFLIEELAAEAYDEAARYQSGEFATLNFPKEGERSCL